MKNLMTRSSDDANSWIVLNTSKLRSTTPLICKFYFLLNLNCILLYLWKTIKKLNIQINMILRRGLFVINIFKRLNLSRYCLLSFDLTGSLRKKTHTLLWLGHSMIEGKKSLSPHPPSQVMWKGAVCCPCRFYPLLLVYTVHKAVTDTFEAHHSIQRWL